MIRRCLLALAVASAGLVPAQAADATPLCFGLRVEGVIRQQVGPACVPYGGAADCAPTSANALSILIVTVDKCAPDPLVDA